MQNTNPKLGAYMYSIRRQLKILRDINEADLAEVVAIHRQSGKRLPELVNEMRISADKYGMSYVLKVAPIYAKLHQLDTFGLTIVEGMAGGAMRCGLQPAEIPSTEEMLWSLMESGQLPPGASVTLN